MPGKHASHHTEATHQGDLLTTRWSLVLARRDQKGSQEALGWLCERYWLPLYAFARSRGDSAEQAKDLVEAFLERFLSRNLAEEGNFDRGRFRSFLLTCLNQYLSADQKRVPRVKQGSLCPYLRIDDPNVEARIEAELSDRRQPEVAFDRQWAVTLMDQAIERLRTECEADGRSGSFEVLKPCLTEGVGDAPQAELAERLKVSVTAVNLIIQRLRRRYREIVREEVAETVTSGEDVEAELRHLLATLRS